jgi:hypothetical protein
LFRKNWWFLVSSRACTGGWTDMKPKETTKNVFRLGRPLLAPSTILGCVLVALKVTGKLTISWWLALLPLYWLPVLGFLILTVAVLAFVVCCLAWCVVEFMGNPR